MKSIFQKIVTQLQSYDFYETFRDSINYFGATLLINALGIISLPIYTYFFSPGQFGIAEIFNTLCKIGLALFTLNFHQSVFRYYVDDKEEGKEAFVGSSILLTTGLLVISCLLVLLFKEPIANWLNLPVWLLPLVFPIVFFTSIIGIYYQVQIARKDSKKAASMEIFVSYSRFLVVVGILYFLLPDYWGKVYGDIIAVSAMGMYALWQLRSHIRFDYAKKHLEYILNYSFPLVFGSLGYLILSYFDQLMINAMVGDTETGLYSYAYKIGLLMSGLGVAMNKAGQTDFFKWMNESDFDAVKSQHKSLAKLLTLGAIFLILFAFDMGQLLSSREDFNTALHLVPILVVAYWFTGIYLYYARGIMFVKRTIYLSISVVIAGMVNVGLNLWLIPIHGYEVAAWTTLASCFTMALCCLIILKVAFKDLYFPPISVWASKFVYILIAALILYGLNTYTELSFVWSLLVRILVFGMIGFLFFGSKIMAYFNKEVS